MAAVRSDGSASRSAQVNSFWPVAVTVDDVVPPMSQRTVGDLIGSSKASTPTCPSVLSR
jgi:hypothetical protein